MHINLATYALSALAVFVLSSIIRHVISPLRSIPGPFAARFTRLWFLYRVWKCSYQQDDLALHQKYGRIVRYGPYHYSISDPGAIKIIYGSGTEFDKSSWYESWNAPGFKSLFTEPSVKVHGQHRRKFQSMYTMSSLITYEGFADKCIELLSKRFEEILDTGGKMDLSKWLLYYAGDTVAMITYSRRMGFLDAGQDIGNFFGTLHENLVYSSLMGIYAGLHPLVFNTIAWLNKMKIMHGTARMFVTRFNGNLIAEKRKERAMNEQSDASDEIENENAPKDFLSKFLDLHEKDSSKFTERDINIGLLGNVVAGADTTAAALTAVFYCLLKNKTAMSKLRAEISDRLEADELSSPPTFKQTHNMQYLQAAIQEAMRLYAPVGLPLQRVVPEGGYEICGHHFPAGTVVGSTALTLHMDTSIFGEDAAEFRPERWIEADKEKLAYMQKHWMPFGLGSRTCIGKHISMLEISKVVPEIIRSFDIELDGELKNGKEMEWINYWFLLPVTLPVRLKKRQE